MSFFSNLFQSKFPLVGVDISDSSIELLQLKTNKELKTCSREKIPAKLMKNSEIKDLDKLAGVLKKAYQAASPGFSSQSCLLSLPDKQSFFWVFDLKPNEADLDKRILKVAQGKLPLDLKTCYYDYLVTDLANGKKEVFFVAAEKNIIDQYIKLFEQADLNLEVIDFESACLARALLTEEDKKEAGFIVDLGAEVTDIVLTDQKGFRDQINIPLAGDALTQKIAEHLKIEPEKAEKIKKEQGVLIKEKDCQTIILDFFENFFSDIYKMQENYQDKTNKQVKKIYLVGGSSLLKGIKELFAENLNDLEVVLGQPDKKINLSNKKLPANKIYYTNVIGLALRGLNKNTLEQGINLVEDY